MHLLSVENISLNYHSKAGEISVLKNINIKIEKGEFVSILGPSGCGKSTLLNIINGILPPSSGTISFNNQSISFSKEKMGYMFQNDHLFPWISVWNNVILPLKIKHKINNTTLELADKLISSYGLEEFRNRYPGELSGGMRQRVALIRTLTLEPELLLLDEPFSALDYQTRLKLCDEVYEIIKKENKTAIMVTHDISEAISMSERILVLSSRPASVKKEFILSFSSKDELPFKRRKEENFRVYFNEIWSELL